MRTTMDNDKAGQIHSALLPSHLSLGHDESNTPCNQWSLSWTKMLTAETGAHRNTGTSRPDPTTVVLPFTCGLILRIRRYEVHYGMTSRRAEFARYRRGLSKERLTLWAASCPATSWSTLPSTAASNCGFEVRD